MIYVVVGPTGSGKTDLANYIATKLNAPLINGDAFQIYQEMDIGTNKLSKDDPLYKRYFMIDIASPEVTYSVKDYQTQGREILNQLLKDNKDVVIVGGTGLYIKALLYDYSFNEEITNEVSKYDNYSNKELHELLTKLDKEESIKIHENNRKRVIRAITMIENNKASKTDLLSKQEHKRIYNDVKIIFINPNREKLYQRINERVDKMIDSGLVKEVKELNQKYRLSITAKQGIGYKEIISYLDNECTLDEAIELIKKRTRNYAKRQVTFFKHQFENIESYSSVEEAEKLIKLI